MRPTHMCSLAQRMCQRLRMCYGALIIIMVSQDYISFRHHTYEQPKGIKSIQLMEVGPRFEAKIYQVKLGTLDQQHAENEWVVHAYTRSAKKAKLAAIDSE